MLIPMPFQDAGAEIFNCPIFATLKLMPRNNYVTKMNLLLFLFLNNLESNCRIFVEKKLNSYKGENWFDMPEKQ